MSAVKYNEAEEAFELEYKLWGNSAKVLFYVETEQQIMDDLSAISETLDRIDRNREKIAGIILREKVRHPHPEIKSFAESLSIDCAYVEPEDGEIYVRFIVSDAGCCLSDRLELEYSAENGVEVIGWYGQVMS
ncbi:MAG: hypothetical protein J6M17_13365 [Ruminococcus sp.]|nr:hypothetical protein [Ruminococcus sp.]MBP3273192.1 hypothetical protein [Ruminococcus sp.]